MPRAIRAQEVAGWMQGPRRSLQNPQGCLEKAKGRERGELASGRPVAHSFSNTC
jgi:hypothetical protein